MLMKALGLCIAGIAIQGMKRLRRGVLREEIRTFRIAVNLKETGNAYAIVVPLHTDPCSFSLSACKCASVAMANMIETNATELTPRMREIGLDSVFLNTEWNIKLGDEDCDAARCQECQKFTGKTGGRLWNMWGGKDKKYGRE